MILEKTLENPLDCKEIKPVKPKGNQLWIFIGRTNGEAEATILWPPDTKSQVPEKDPDAGKDWGQEEKLTAEDEIVVWHPWLNGHEFEHTLGDGEGQGSLVCCLVYGIASSRKWLSDWTTMDKRKKKSCSFFRRNKTFSWVMYMIKYGKPNIK